MRSALIATAMLFSLTATAAPARYELVHPRVCLAGGWGDPHAEWRVQLAITSSERFALAFEQRLAKRGIHAEHYIAVWRANGDREPLAVVTRQTFPSRAAAIRAAQKLRRAGFAAFPRHFVHYR